jgi:hypothetical protein
MANTKTHVQYINSQGERVAGVTTILGLLDKPAIHYWIARITKAGYDWTKYRDKLADIGTITHLRILCHLKGIEPDLSEYAPADVKQSDNCMLSFTEWNKSHKLEPITLEVPWTSDIYNYGGTADYLGLVNGRLEIIDFKTGNALYGEYSIQLAAYRQLAQELGHKVEHARLLRIGRDNNEGFEERLISKFDNEFELFKHLLAIYNLQKLMGKT